MQFIYLTEMLFFIFFKKKLDNVSGLLRKLSEPCELQRHM